MNRFRKSFSLFGALLLLVSSWLPLNSKVYAADPVNDFTPGTSAQQLVNHLTQGSPISVVPNSETLKGSLSNTSTYSKLDAETLSDSTRLTLNQGIFINSTDGSGAAYGDEQLQAVLTGANNYSEVTNASALQFQFTVPEGKTSIALDFIFASQESYTSDYDIAAVFVDDVNYAFMPNGSILRVNQAAKLENYTPPVLSDWSSWSPPQTLVGLLDPNRMVHTLRIAVANTDDDIAASGIFVSNLIPGNSTEGGVVTEAATPTANPTGGEVAAGTTVALATSTDGATIHYTTDGSTPTSSSQVYSTPIPVNAAMTIKAIAVKAGLSDSAVMSESYTITTPQNSLVTPTSASFDKYAASAGYADVETTLTLNGNTLSSIDNGGTPLTENTDYTVSGSAVTIKKEYLAAQPEGTTNLTFTFSAGAPQTLAIAVSDTTPENSLITPTSASFDKYAASAGYADVETTLTLNGNTLSSIENGGTPLTENTDYTVSGSTVKIKKEYLADQPEGTTSLTFAFSAGAPKTLAITVSDTTPVSPGVPKLKSAIAGNEKVTLNWSPVNDSTGYKIYQSVTSDTYGAEVATVQGSVYSYNVTGLTNGKTYYFVVKATNPGGDSAASNQVSATPKTVPVAPADIAATTGNGQATITFTAPADNGGSAITGYEVTSSPGNIIATGTTSPITITGLQNGTTYTFTVKAINSAGSSVASAVSNAVTPLAPSSGDGGSTPAVPTAPSAPEPTNTGVDALVNGNVQTVGTGTTSKVNDQAVTTVVIDPKKLDDILAAEGQNAVITIPVNTKADVVIGELNGQIIKNMEQKQAVLEIKTENATYTLPAQQININNISDQLGKQIALQDIKVQIEIAAPTADTAKTVENSAATGQFTIVVPPLNFTVRGVYGDTKIEVSKFNAYVERTLAIPDGIDPNKITTGVVIEPDGAVRHVPTQIINIDGKYYAKVSSLTNSTYSVVWHPLEFKDVAKHWAKDAVNDMGSRMIVTGSGNNMFNPDQDITRAEFAAIIVRGLGLKLESAAAPFSDVQQSDWYNDIIQTSYAYNLISGFEDGTFRPNDKITREQAMTIIAKAMTITDLKAKLPSKAAGEVLSSFGDANKISGWAKNSAADCLQAGIISGRTSSQLSPKDNITRAEVAAIIQRLLQKSELIN
ncbi:X2-like carbohydrate binding domain-containing protein [Paenibacillus sp. URB8-2]|uniref:X2-like carbohydrate binding domain-containing protein n=1 Tax=Paenibacillus sp. URB8-2 TaxID=2741301 RepID=UPI001E3FA5AD|nr:X2-like carbohydrate binding domain-containing protein [Paenibacillus sp. URB8-2]